MTHTVFGRAGAVCVAALLAVCALTVAAPATASQRVVVGCTEGAVDTHDQAFPAQALGADPDRVANWELAFQRGRYSVRIASRFEFFPGIFKQVNGQYRDAGLSKRIQMQNDRSGNAFFHYDFTANHMADIDRNFWLLQIKPKPEAQTVPHKIRVVIRVDQCPGQTPPQPYNPCPPGYKPAGQGTFGQTNCVKK